MFASHHWPRWGNARIQEVLRGQRDLYAHMNNQVLHLANQGVTINEIHNVYELPQSIQQHVVQPRLSRLAAAQQPRRDPAFPWFLGCKPGDPDPALTRRLGAAVCRDDGWRREDPRSRRAALRRRAPTSTPRRSSTSWCRRSRRTRRPRICSQTSSSRSATSRRIRGCVTAILAGCLRAAQRHSPGRNRQHLKPAT